MRTKGGRKRLFKTRKAYQTHQLNERRAGNVNDSNGVFRPASQVVTEKIAKSHLGGNHK